jgi:hypothetical protein
LRPPVFTMSYYNNQTSCTTNPYGQHELLAPQHDKKVDLGDCNNASSQYDSRSAESSHITNSNHSTPSIDKPYEEQPAPYQQITIVEHPTTHKVQFNDGFRGSQRTDTRESARFSLAREKFLKQRVRYWFTRQRNYPHTALFFFLSPIYLILFGSPSTKCPCRMAI